MASIKWVQGDSAPVQPFTITQGGSALNLTGCTVNFNIGDSSYVQINSGHAGCTITNAAAGQVSYTPVTSDTATAGTFIGQIEVIFAGGTRQTGKDVAITIAQQVA